MVTSGKPERDGKPTGNQVYNPEKFKVEEERMEVMETDQVDESEETSGRPLCKFEEVIVSLEVLPGFPTEGEKDKLPASGQNNPKVEPSLDKS